MNALGWGLVAAFATIAVIAIIALVLFSNFKMRMPALPITLGAPAPGPAPAAPASGFWRRNWFWILLGSFAVPGAVFLIWFFGGSVLHWLSELSVPPQTKTWVFTTFNPMCMVLIVLIVAVVIALCKRNWPMAGGLVATALVAYTITYHYRPARTCASDDVVCIHAQQERIAAAEAQKEAQAAAAQRARLAAYQPTAPSCNVNRMDYTYEAHKPTVPFNPGGHCEAALFFAGHGIYVTQAHQDKVLGPYYKEEGGTVWDKNHHVVNLPVDIEYAWSAGESFTDSVGLWQPRYTQLFQ